MRAMDETVINASMARRGGELGERKGDRLALAGSRDRGAEGGGAPQRVARRAGVSAGRPLEQLRVLLGYAFIITTQKYAHLAPARLRDAIDVLDQPI